MNDQTGIQVTVISKLIVQVFLYKMKILKTVSSGMKLISVPLGSLLAVSLYSLTRTPF